MQHSNNLQSFASRLAREKGGGGGGGGGDHHSACTKMIRVLRVLMLDTIMEEEEIQFSVALQPRGP